MDSCLMRMQENMKTSGLLQKSYIMSLRKAYLDRVVVHLFPIRVVHLFSIGEDEDKERFSQR